MRSLAARYADVKLKVGGNREKTRYEDTFGMPKEEVQHITPPNKWNRRILSETEFAIRLSAENGGMYDADVSAALDILERAMAEDGVLTAATCLKAEEKLLPLAGKAKEYKLILAGHAHIDMNWMWGWQETVSITLSTFRTMLHIMDEYPEFCFSQSQASVYQIVEMYDPELMDAIKARIKEGRWEITASAWVETDKNMPNTESLLNHIRYTRKYLEEHWGVDPNSLTIDFSPDTFGHSRHLPELDAQGGVRYYYHCRGLEELYVAYRWRAPSGQEMLCHKEPYWYNSAIVPDTGIGAIEISKRCGGLKTGLVVYGVGDHGGGPTRRDVERAIEMDSWPVFPQYKFGTLHQYFAELEAVRDKLPLVDHEMNFLLTGCYTTQSRLKLGNRHAESALNSAQAWSAVANRALGRSYAHTRFEKAWQDVLFTHFHDILTGSCVQESREHGMGLIADAMAIAHTEHGNAMRVLSENIDTSFAVTETDPYNQAEGAGAGYGLTNYAGVPNPERGSGKTRIFNVFNPSAHTRTDRVEITCWDYTGDLRYLTLKDPKGNDVPFQLLDSDLEKYWDHRYFRFLAEVTVPALGYTTIVLSEKDREVYDVQINLEDRTQHAYENFVLENEFIRAEFDYMDGGLISFIDKATGNERVNGKASVVLLNTEDRTSSAWNIGRYLNRIPVSRTITIHKTMDGELRKGFEMEQEILRSKVKTSVSLDHGSKALTYSFYVEWNEKGEYGDNIPVLAFYMPLADDIVEYLYDVPGGSMIRGDLRQEVPGLQYGAAHMADGRAVALITDCKYGYRGADNSLTSTFINSATNPDPDPERGEHKITLHIAAEDFCPKTLEETASEKNHAMNYEPANSHKGVLPPVGSFLTFDGGTAVISSMTLAENGEVVFTVYETCGEDTVVTLGMPGMTEARMTDLNGNVMEVLSVKDEKTVFALLNNTIRTVRVK